MRLIKHEITKAPNGRTVIKGEWRDQMRRPVQVETTITSGDLAQDGAHTLVEGSTEDVSSIMFAQADLAWAMGWRPRGLLGAIPQFIQGYKLPPEAR